MNSAESIKRKVDNSVKLEQKELNEQDIAYLNQIEKLKKHLKVSKLQKEIDLDKIFSKVTSNSKAKKHRYNRNSITNRQVFPENATTTSQG